VTGLVALHQSSIERVLRKNNWDVLAFSVSAPSYEEALSIACNVKKKYNIFIMFGGPHATFCPEIIEERAIDAVCRGEGEFALLEFLERMDQKKSARDVLNWWVKEDGKVFKNELRPLIQDLDSLPYVDRDMAKGFNYFAPESQEILIARGCLFNCNYCFNELYSDLYHVKGKPIRSRSVGNVIEELKFIKSSLSPKRIAILDDLYPFDSEWNRQFCERYKREIGLPFLVKPRPGYLTKEMVNDLKEAGCDHIWLGLESANEKLRTDVLNRCVKNSSIEDSCKMVRSAQINLGAFILCGIPSSTIEDDLDTFAYARKLQVDLPVVSALQPYPKTKIFNWAVQNGCLDHDYKIKKVGLLNSRHSPFKFPLKSQNRMIYNLVCLYGFWLDLKLPLNLLRLFIRFPFGLFYFLILKFWGPFKYTIYSIGAKEKRKISIISVIRYVLWTR